jgi:hypothetical protein
MEEHVAGLDDLLEISLVPWPSALGSGQAAHQGTPGENRVIGHAATQACLKPSSGGYETSGILHGLIDHDC